MDENTRITFVWRDVRSDEVLREETRTLREWTGLTDEALKGGSVMHLDGVLDQVMMNWAEAQQRVGWRIENASEEAPNE